MEHSKILAAEFGISEAHATNIINLIDEGCTIPFIARYRKEMTGSCDDQVLRSIADRLQYLRNLDKRKEEVIASIDSQGKLTDELRNAVMNAKTLAEVEDLYRPYKQKRRTRATVARERGLEPLAEIIFAQEEKTGNPLEFAAEFVDEEKGVPDAQAAIQGAMDIIAENLSDDAEIRRELKERVISRAVIVSKGTTEEDTVYRMYYDYNEPSAKMPSHRILAVNRGEKEGVLKVAVEVQDEMAIDVINRRTIKGANIFKKIIEDTTVDAWDRLIFPSLEREARSAMTETAAEQAISMFGLNLRQLLLQPPLRGKTVMGFDPAYRTGCKLAVVDNTGKVLDTAVIYPTPPNNKVAESKAKIKQMIQKHDIGVIAIGNGTASKESEIFVAEMIKEIAGQARNDVTKRNDNDRSDVCGISYIIVNEAGASVYSASKLAAEEFPEYDVSLRSAVSIARRLQDPLAELVKIDPKSIGVGQYQHDMPQARLDFTLTNVVEDCVNNVGVDVNTASPSLLSYVSGLSAAVSKNICTYRDENGSFTSRTQYKKVAKLGPKSFEQCAGFLRITNGKNILDNTSVHPESYDAAKKLLGLFGYKESDVAGDKLGELKTKLNAYGLVKAAEECGVGVPTLTDIVNELLKPGRDIRDSLPQPVLRTDVLSMEDLKPGMDFMGTVRNVIDFGAFVDIGVHQDGLVHISRMVNRYIKHPSEVVKVGDVVKVWVLECDVAKKRISLTMIDNR